MKYLDKLKKQFNLSKKTLKFIIGISILGFIFGSLITLVLFLFYIFHYYFLENTTQELYKHYFSIREKK